MTDRTLSTAQALGWVLVAVGLVTVLVAVDRPAPEGWALLLGFGLMGGGGLLAGLRYILR